MLTESDDHIPRRGFLGLTAWPPARRYEKDRIGVPAKMMAENMEGTDRIAKSTGDILRLAAFDKIGTEGLIGAVLGVPRFKEEAATFA